MIIHRLSQTAEYRLLEAGCGVSRAAKSNKWSYPVTRGHK